MNTPLIFAAGKIVDGIGDLDSVTDAEKKLCASTAGIVSLSIDPLSKGWDTPLEDGHFRSGCAPIEALFAACDMINRSVCDAVIIKGTDNLKSGYQGRHEMRRRLMNIYGSKCTLPEAYTLLAYEFIDTVNMTPDAFKNMTEKLYDNYRRTALKNNTYRSPDERWFDYVTALFRGVDCANPFVDFSAGMIIGTREAADLCGVPEENRISVLGVGLAHASGDGPAQVKAIASFKHLKNAWDTAAARAGVDFPALFVQGKALLEVYSCYPVIPFAFLLASGLAPAFDDIDSILHHYDMTVTGGMNIARAAWNNPALNALVSMYKRLCSTGTRLGAVHGNGGLGFKQGVAFIGRK
jgi:hypothetical protein